VVLINTLYAKTVTALMNTQRPKLYSNLLCGAVQIGIYFFLNSRGTENPLNAVVPSAILGFTLTNVQNRGRTNEIN